jgi:hypothetical protein
MKSYLCFFSVRHNSLNIRVKNVWKKGRRQKMKHLFYVQYTFSITPTAFEIIKQDKNKAEFLQNAYMSYIFTIFSVNVACF